MKLSRRGFLKLVAATPAPFVAPGLVHSAGSANSNILVCVFLAGGVDGLNMIAPYGDPDYYAQRGDFALEPPNNGTEHAVLALDGFFGMHPAMASLLPFYSAGSLGIVHAAGSPHETHSHFDARLFMQAGILDDRSPDSGWLGRHLATAPAGPGSAFQALSGTGTVALPLRGPTPVMAMSSINEMQIKSRWKHKLVHAVSGFYDGDSLLDTQTQQSFAAATLLEQTDPLQYTPENGADYPTSSFGQKMHEIGQMIKAGLGVEVAYVERSGWDTHQSQSRTLDYRLRDLADTLAAFATDMGNRMDGITVAVMSEFGRRVRPNASGGTDHGHGGCMLLLGGGVMGGQVYADWPGLADADLYGPGDLQVTTDYRAVLGELLARRFASTALDQVFPGFQMPASTALFA